MNNPYIQEIFATLRANNPSPTTELIFKNPFELLIAVLLSAQATDISVNKATKGLFRAAPTPEKMLELGLDGIKSHIKTIGLFNSKAKHIVATCEKLITAHHSEIPQTREALELLPGVGRKTANVVLNTAYGQPTLAVDTHIFRVAHRLQLSNGKTPDHVETDLMKQIPKEFLKDAHHWLILHGRYCCKARKPLCGDCPISNYCPYQDKT